MRLDTSGMETMQCTFQDNTSDDEDSPPPSQISGGRDNSPPLPVRGGLKGVEYVSFEGVWTFYGMYNKATISHISWWCPTDLYCTLLEVVAERSSGRLGKLFQLTKLKFILFFIVVIKAVVSKFIVSQAWATSGLIKFSLKPIFLLI